MRRAFLVSALLALAGGPGCSLVGLDRLERAQCDGDAFCASLNDSMPTGDACLTWQCNPVSRFCEPMARDDDGDDAPSMECAPSGETPDCDDADAARSPLFTEATCDQVDEDCDGAIDEGLDAGGNGALATMDSFETVVLAGSPDEDELVAVIGLAPGEMRVVAAPPGETTSSVDSMLSAPGLSVRGPAALAGIGDNRYALLLRPAGACARLAPAIVDLGASPVAAVSEDVWADPGLPKPGGSCPDASDPVGPAALAARDLSRGAAVMLAAWIEDASERSCGAAPARNVVVAGARISSGGARTVSASALTIGTSIDPSAPPVVAIADDRFLLARVAGSGAIEVHEVTLDASLGLATSVVHTEPAGATDRGAVSLALGEPDDSGALALALAWREGCSEGSTVRWRPLRVDPASGEIATEGPAAELARGAALGSPRFAWQPRDGAWLATWLVSNQRMEAVRLGAGGDPLAPAFEAMPVRGVRPPSLVVARQTGAGWGVATARIDATAQAVQVATAGCAPE